MRVSKGGERQKREGTKENRSNTNQRGNKGEEKTENKTEWERVQWGGALPLVRPKKWGHSQVGFRGSNASGGRIVLLPGAFWAHGASFQNGHFGRISSTLYFTVFQSLGGHASAGRVSHEPCFRQAHCFVQGPLHFRPMPPNLTCARSRIWGFPIHMVWSRGSVNPFGQVKP